MRVRLRDGSVLEDELAVADAHPNGASPFGRGDYLAKFRSLTQGRVAEAEQERFLLLAQRLPELAPHELAGLTPAVDARHLGTEPGGEGIF